MEYPVFNSAKQSIFDVRRQARTRAFICPGAGFAALGYRKIALLTFVVVVAAWSAALATAWEPTPDRFWITVALVVVGILLWLGELLTAHSDSIDFAPPQASSKFWPWVGAIILLTLAVSFVSFVAVSYSLFRAGPEMSPTLRSGKRLLVRRTVAPGALTHGKFVLFGLSASNQRAEPGRMTIGRILAVPGDRLSLRSGRYYVNGVAGRRAARHAGHFLPVVVPEFPEFTTVPAGSYYVTQDSATDGLDSAILSWAEHERLISTEFLDLTWDRLLLPVDQTPKFDLNLPPPLPAPTGL